MAVEEQGQPSAASDSRMYEHTLARALPSSLSRDDTDAGVSDGRPSASASALSSRWAALLLRAGSRTARTTASAYASRQRAGKWRASLSRIAPVSDQARLEAPTSTTSETAGSSARLALPALGTSPPGVILPR